MHRITSFHISQQGDSHIKSKTNCQDSSGTIRVTNEFLRTEIVVAAIADGVGSCDFSEYGSQNAVTTVLNKLSQDLSVLKEISEKTVPQLIKKAFQQAYDNIELEANERERPFLLFDTTLTVAVLIEDGSCYVGHVGDDGIVALFTDGTYSVVTSRMKGEESNSVIPLLSKKYWEFGVLQKPVAALALMTDGLLDKSTGSKRMNHQVYYPFFKPLFASIMETDQDELEMRMRWDNYLSEDKFRTSYGVTDDITLAVVQIPSLLRCVTPVPFDEEKWKEDSERIKKEIEDKLNSARFSEEVIQTPTKGPDSFDTEVDSTEPEEHYDSTIEQVADTLSSMHNPQYNDNEFNNINGDNRTPNNLQTDSQINNNTTEFNPLHENDHKTNSIESVDPKKRRIDNAIRILVSALALICFIGIVMLSGLIGYNKGRITGQQQEQAISQGKMSSLEQTHEQELKDAFERGKETGKQEILDLATATPTITNTPEPQAITPEQFVFSQGQKGQNVTTIQTMLNNKGWKIKADGVYGQKTAKAVREFQEANNLQPTGEVDLLTYWALLYEGNKGVELEDTPTPTLSIESEPEEENTSDNKSNEYEKTVEQITSAPPTEMPPTSDI